MEVKIRNRIWLMEQWFDRFGGCEHAEIVVSSPDLAADTNNGKWVVTEYIRTDLPHIAAAIQIAERGDEIAEARYGLPRCTCDCKIAQGIYHDGDCPAYKAAISG